MPEQSKQFSLNKDDLKKLLKGLGVAVGGAVVTYLASAITQIDFGSWTPFVVALSSVLVNAARKFLAGQSL